MHRIDTPTAQKDKFGAGKNGFTKGDPQTGTPATEIDETILDALQEEICCVIENAGIQLDKKNNNQLFYAISKMFSNLQLGSASRRDVGSGVSQLPDMSSFSLGMLPAFRLPTGHIVQMDSGVVTGGGFVKSFPTPFPNGVLMLIGIVYGTLGIRFSATSNVSDRRAANINFVDHNGNGLSGTTVGYLAIGW